MLRLDPAQMFFCLSRRRRNDNPHRFPPRQIRISSAYCRQSPPFMSEAVIAPDSWFSLADAGASQFIEVGSGRQRAGARSAPLPLIPKCEIHLGGTRRRINTDRAL
jgi:hypothetical protein